MRIHHRKRLGNLCRGREISEIFRSDGSGRARRRHTDTTDTTDVPRISPESGQNFPQKKAAPDPAPDRGDLRPFFPKKRREETWGAERCQRHFGSRAAEPVNGSRKEKSRFVPNWRHSGLEIRIGASSCGTSPARRTRHGQSRDTSRTRFGQARSGYGHYGQPGHN